MTEFKTLHELETPSVLIDLEKMTRNIERMQSRCDALNLNFRPHVKTHKIPEIAQMQMDAGAVGIACQKVSEAEVFTNVHDILLPYHILGERKVGRLADLAQSHHVTSAVDSPEGVAGLSAVASARGIVFRVVVDLVTEIERTGTSVAHAVKLAEMIDRDPHLHFAGLMIYPSFPTVRPILQEALAQLQQKGIPVEMVSGGGIGAAAYAQEVPELTEIRVGTYVFNDLTTVRNGYATFDDCAMVIETTVTNLPTPNKAVLDAGSKTLTQELYDGTYGYVIEYPDARLNKLNEEHGHLDLTHSAEKPKIGEIVHIIPVHTCVVTNMHNQIFGVRGENIEVVWDVAARGRVW